MSDLLCNLVEFDEATAKLILAMGGDLRAVALVLGCNVSAVSSVAEDCRSARLRCEPTFGIDCRIQERKP